MKNRWYKRSVALLCGLLIVLAQVLPVAAEETSTIGDVSSTEMNTTGSETLPEAGDGQVSKKETVKGYEAYLAYYRGVRTVEAAIVAEPILSNDIKIGVYDGLEGYVLEAGKKVTVTFTVEKNGFYPLAFTYYALPGKGMDIGVRVLVDDVLPFQEAAHISLKRCWKDQIDTVDGEFETDLSGDQRIPSQVEVAGWQMARPHLSGVLRDETMKVYLRAGTHTITFEGVQESCAIRQVTLGATKAPVSYEQYLNTVGRTADASAEALVIEAEKVTFKSDNGLSPYSDQSTPNVSPNRADQILLNAIGGYSWRETTQWLQWNFTVKHTGWYTLTFHDRQADKRGLGSFRTIYIDDDIPFAEFSAVEFAYSRQWLYDTLADSTGTPYRIWLEQGDHTLRMEACFGESASALSGLKQSLDMLNAIYRDIIVVTGATPDANRDYYLEAELPNLLTDIEAALKSLQNASKLFDDLGAAQGGDISYIQVVVDQLTLFLKDPSEIAPKLTSYRSNITVLADILLSMKEQPLALDTIIITPADQTVKMKKVSWWDTLCFRIALFLNSFATDYSQISGGEGKEAIRVWVSQSDVGAAGVAVGRDQAQLIQKMVQSDFYAKTGIPVQLSLVNSGSALIQSIVSGRNPDLVMFAGEGMPITLALRGAAEDLSVYEGFEEVKARFHPSAFRSFIHGDGVYAIPDVQTFYVTFYRTDIFEELNLEVPDTWEEFYTLVKKLQRKNLSAGIAGGDQNVFETLLLQNGSNLYLDDLSATCLTDAVAIDTFDMWTRLYSHFGLDVAFDFLSRFRSGEMPIGIMPLNMYNVLVASAPEIDGLWTIDLIPGTVRENGEINRSESCAVTGTVLLKQANNKENCFRFMDWWSSKEIQTRFGVETEATFGVSNRYLTANVEAFYQLPWSPSETFVLSEQWSVVDDVLQTPASYYVSRCINNAFRNVVYYYKNPREIMTKYAAQMDEELERKRREFGLID